jgi:hypothetical protein
MLLFFVSKAIIKCVAVRRPVCGDEYCKSTSTYGIRKQKSTTQMVNLLRHFDTPDDEII